MDELTLAAACIVITVIAIQVWKRLMRRPDSVISLVYLLREPRPLSERMLRDRLSNTLGVALSAGEPEATHSLVQMTPPSTDNFASLRATMFMLRLEDRIFGINNAATPYVQDRESFADAIPDGRLQRAIREHTAWLSVDLVSGCSSQDDKQRAYRIIGRAMAGLAGEDCLAIYCPELGRCNEFDDSLVELLRSDEPLALFDACTFAPVLNVNADDPRFKAAVEEARKRWPEFAAAFHAQPNTEAPYIVKARFEEGGRVEFMWATVTAIEDDTIHGTLENTPNELRGIRAGDAVRIALEDLNDWLYLKGEESVGGFTQKIMVERLGK